MTFFAFFILSFVFNGTTEAQKGNEAYNNGNFIEAERLYKKSLEKKPADIKVLFNLGNALAMQNKVEEAIETYEQIETIPKITQEQKSMVAYNIGTLLANQEEWEKSEPHLRKALQLNPTDEESIYNYEWVLNKLNEQKEENQEEQSSEQKPPPPSEYAKYLKKQADELVTQQQYEQALLLMQEGLQKDESVQYYNDFIQRLSNVQQIN